MNFLLIPLGLVLVVASYVLSLIVMRFRISNQVRKMLTVMKADELGVEQPGDAYEDSDSVFTDLERAAYSLRRKYLNLKKKSADERRAFETVFSGLKEGIVTIDQDLRLISFNTMFLKIFNWSPPDFNFRNYFLHDVVRDPEIVNLFKRSFQERIYTRHETDRFQISVNPLPSTDDRQNWALGVFYDISESKKLEKIKVDLVANASHELRTPLTIIRGYSELLNKEISQKHPALKVYIDPILDGIHTMNDLSDDLLSLARLEQRNELKREKLSTQEITEAIVMEIDSLVAIHKKTVLCRYEAEFVVVERKSVQQILRNLIVNAVRHSGKNSNEIHVTWKQDHKQIILSVKDFGQGIPEEHMARIFERFYRIDKGRNRDQGGSGLGLALVKHHMMANGGDVKVISSVNKGTEFICTFSHL
jgi:two-component system, OmpR family, phosphate regulon sensor histidine kinase PhoR